MKKLFATLLITLCCFSSYAVCIRGCFAGRTFTCEATYGNDGQWHVSDLKIGGPCGDSWWGPCKIVIMDHPLAPTDAGTESALSKMSSKDFHSFDAVNEDDLGVQKTINEASLGTIYVDRSKITSDLANYFSN